MELEWLYDEVQMYSFLKKHCEEKGFINALRSLDYAMIQHEGQIRKGNGAPYVTHPMAVAFFMILLQRLEVNMNKQKRKIEKQQNIV